MLQIRLSRQGSSSENTGGARPSGGDTVTVACPDHLVLADLPVAKSIGTANTATQVKIVGRRSRRHLGERVHFCVRCDFPIAIYGRLSPCSHAFCLDCARSDASCYLCDQRIQKIQTIKMMEGILICAAPHCLKSFMKKSDFETHLHEYHSHLLQPHAEKEDGNESDAVNVTRPSSIDAHAKQSAPADSSTARAPPRTVISPSSNSQPHDLEDKSRRNQPREQPPTKPPIVQPKPPAFYPRPQQHENNTPPVFDRSGPYNRFHNQHSGDMQGGQLDRRDSDQFPGKQQQGNLAESPFRDYPMHSHPPPSFIVPVTPNPGLVPPFNYSPFPPEGAQSFYNASYEIVRQDMTSTGGSDPSSLLGFPSTPSGGTGIREGYPQPWNMGLAALPFEQMQLSQGVAEGYASQLDSQGRTAFFQGDYQRVPGMLPLQPPLMPAMVGKALEPLQSGSASDNKDGIAGLTPDTMSLPPPPPPPPHFSQLPPQGNFPHSGDTGRDGQNYGWQIENLDGFRGDRSREK